MSINHRRILGEPADNGLTNASAVDGADNSLASRNYVAPLGVTDTASAATEAERGGLETSFRQARAEASRIEPDAGAGGKAVR